MDFFAAQDRSRRQSRRLVWLYLLATLVVVLAVTSIVGGAWYVFGEPGVARPGLVAWSARHGDALGVVAFATLGLIVIASLFRVISLRGGGAQIARQLGGAEVPPDTSDLLRRRLRNVVEEMAIAAGVPVPQVFVLEQESGINAFAAGYRPEDAAIAVTRGALERLQRDELQGVIAHEFSHILNGDMRLNIRMMGPLFGIMVIGFIGRLVLRNLRASRGSGRRGGGVPVVIVVALGLTIIGIVGVWMARLIRAGVSRQREYLADASAVQFTRQAEGLAGALKKIAGLSSHSYLQRTDAEEVSHMLFASGGRISRLFASHPPLMERIHRLDPGFDSSQLQAVQAGELADEHADGTAGLAATLSPPAADTQFDLRPEVVVRQAGDPQAAQIAIAHGLHRSIPAELYAAAHDDRDAPLLALSLVLPAKDSRRDLTAGLLLRQLGAVRAGRAGEFARQLAQIGPQYRLPLLDLAFPALRNRPLEELQFYQSLLRSLIAADGEVELFEYCVARILDRGIANVESPASRRHYRRADWNESSVRQAAWVAFGALAVGGHADPGRRRTALVKGLDHVQPGLGPPENQLDDLLALDAGWPARLDDALEILAGLQPDMHRQLVGGLVLVAAEDGRISVAESELLRVYCAVLECPLPPLYADA